MTDILVLVCGTGSIGMRHLRTLRDRLHLNPIALPMRRERIAELKAEGIQSVETWHQSTSSGPLFAIIATDTARHLADASEALAIGANVLVEKPLAPTVKGMRGLADLAVRSERQVFVACNLRFDAGLRMFRSHLKDIGRVHAVRIECQSFLPEWRPGTDYRRAYSARADEGGVLRDLVHEIDYAIWLFGRPTEVFAQLRNSGRLGIESDEAADILWDTRSGASISIRLDYLSRVSRRKMRAFGEFGDLEWDYFEKSVTLTLDGQQEQIWKIDQERNDMMRDQTAAFLGLDGMDASSCLATLEEGAFAVAVCDTARKSSESRRIETVLDWRNP